MSVEIISRDDEGRTRRVWDNEADIKLGIVQVSNRDRVCNNDAVCNRWLIEGSSYARVMYGVKHPKSVNRWGERYELEQRFHWECTPDDVTHMLPFFFPDQEWKKIEEPELEDPVEPSTRVVMGSDIRLSSISLTPTTTGTIRPQDFYSWYDANTVSTITRS